MAHLERVVPKQRLSASTVFLQPGKTLELSVWGWVDGLSVRSTDESVVKILKPLDRTGKCTVSAVSPNKLEIPRIELVMGSGVWDYFELSVITGAPPPAFTQLQNYVHPGNRKLNVTAFWSKNATPNSFSRTADVSRQILARHGLTLRVTPGFMPSDPYTLPFDELIEFGGQIETLRELAAKTGFAADSRLVVIVAPCAEKLQGAIEETSPYGWTFPSEKYGKPFVVINSAKTSPTSITLLHEIGHACGLGHEHGGPQAIVSNVMNEPERDKFKSPGVAIQRNQVVAIANAFFASD